MRQRTLAGRVAVAALLTIPLATPASALEPEGAVTVIGIHASAEPAKCNEVTNENDVAGEMSGICIVGENVKYGAWYYWGRRGVPGFTTLYVQMCRPDRTACTTISANNGGWLSNSSGIAELETSSKPNSFGHVYRTCASMRTEHPGTFWSYVNVCSPFMV